jgi:outer membrane receptor protein involved in Fe transport
MNSIYQSACSIIVGLGSVASATLALGQTNAPPDASTNITKLTTVTVVGSVSEPARDQIPLSIGTSSYAIDQSQISAQSQGENASFNQLLLRAPGVAQDSAVNGDLHVRGEHANLQYRINGVELPEGIAGFGLELDPRFVQSMQLLTGALPAEFGYRTAGVVDIQTKSGAFEQGGEIGVYGGSYDAIRPSFEYAGSEGKFNYFIDGSYDHNGIGIENPTGSPTPIHDYTDEYKTFMYGTYTMDPSSRFIFMGSVDYSDYEIPNTPGLPAGVAAGGATFASAMTNAPSGGFNSSDLNENQNEQNYYVIGSYQKSAGNIDFQLSAFGRESEQHFVPDYIGDLYFNGVANEVHRSLYSTGLQADGTYQLGDSHTIRGGGLFVLNSVQNDTSTELFNVDGSGNPVPGSQHTIVDDNPLYSMFVGVYLQDEWKLCPQLTLNYGARFDVFSSSFDDENQASPRVNLIYKPTQSTTVHAGYSRYFTPPPVESISGISPGTFAGTTGAAATDEDSSVKAERANYYDVGATQTIIPGLQLGLDGYYKTAENELDDGLFGQTLILSAFNYEKSRIYGLEFSGSYTTNNFSVYGNVAYSVAKGENIDSSQFLFSPNDLVYSQGHWIYLDHDQRFSASGGVSYLFKEAHNESTLVYLDAIYGSGLRQDGGGFEPNDPTAPIPNGSSVPQYYELNLGAEQTFKIGGKQSLKARLDIVNLTDNVYELRSGSGVGVNAPQYGMRRGFFGSLSYRF